MQAPLDVGKLVGAASAPVALIIATSIFLGNLGGKHAAMMAVFRDLSGQYRQTEAKDSVRGSSLKRQITLYSGALQDLARATFWLTVSILSFIATVIFTSIGVIFPGRIWTWITGVSGLVGLLLLVWSVLIEMRENHSTRNCLVLETQDLPGVDGSPDSGGLAGGQMTTLFSGDTDGRAE